MSMTPTQQFIADGGDDTFDDSFEGWMKALDITVATVCSIMCCVGIFLMVTIFQLRRFTFNLYIIFAIFPDCLCNGFIAAGSFYEAFHGGSMPLFLCEWSIFQMTFFFFANLYVNTVITKEVMALVQNSYHTRRMEPPTTKKVVVQVGLIYVFCGLASGFQIVPLSWAFIAVNNNPICNIQFQNIVGSITLYLLLALPAFAYTFWVAYKIWKDKLLPLQGRTRALALYFLRIIVIFVVFEGPIMALGFYIMFVAPDPGESIPISFFVTLKIMEMLYPIQNIVTFHFLLQKDDISMAVCKNTSRISTLLLLRSRDDKIGDTQNTTANAEPKSEWVKDDVYESDRKSTNVDRTNVGNYEDIEGSKENTIQGSEGGNEPNTKSIDVAHPTKEDVVKEEELDL